MLVDVLREQREYEKAEQAAPRARRRRRPDDVNLAAALVQVVSLEAGEAAAAGNAERQRALDEKASTMIREYRKRYPRQRHLPPGRMRPGRPGRRLDRAIAITQEIDKVAKSRPDRAAAPRPALRPAGQAREVAKAYAECSGTRIPVSPTSASCWPRSSSSWASTTRRSSRRGSSSTATRTGSTPSCSRPGPSPSRVRPTRSGRRPARRPSSGSRRRSPSSRDSSRPITPSPRSSCQAAAGGPRRSRPTSAT